MKATVDAELCTACEVCVDTCPEVFQLDDGEDVAVVIVGEVGPDLAESCQMAADDCPTEAITIEE